MPPKATARIGLVEVLLTIGLAAAVISLALTVSTFRSGLDSLGTNGVLSNGLQEKSGTYYLSHAVEIVCLMGAGLIGFAKLRLSGSYYLALIAMVAIAVYIAVAGYTFDQIVSYKIVNPRGPVMCLISVVALASAARQRWGYLSKLMFVLAAALTVLTLISIAWIGLADRMRAVLLTGNYANCLYWGAAWCLLSPGKRRGLAGVATWIPLAVFMFCAILTQTRLSLLMVVFLLVAYLYANKSRPLAYLSPAVVFIAIASISASIGFGNYIDTLTLDSYEGLNARFLDDSRTDQFVSFFEDVPLRDLMIGRGAQAGWLWHGTTWEGATDFGYLSLLFYGGLPLLAFYLFFHVRPAVTVLRSKANELDRACALIAILWAVRMFSSTFPTPSVEYYPGLLCIGKCIGFQSDRMADRRVVSRHSDVGARSGMDAHRASVSGRTAAGLS